MEPTQDEHDSEGIVTRLRRVIFSYDRDATVTAAERYETTENGIDPDTREGPVLRGVDLDISENSFTVIMGASGGGKSTLLRTLNGIIPGFITGTFDGEVDVFGQDATATRVSKMARIVGMVIQDYEAQLFGTSVTTEVAFGPENLAVPPDEIDPRIEESLNIAGLADLDRSRSPGALSGGQKQRLVFAGVLAMYPKLLVLDEPTSDLDPSGSHEILSIIHALAETVHDTDNRASVWDGPETIVMVTHNIEEALLADRAILLKDGQVYRSGSVDDVFTDIKALRSSRVAVPPLVEVFDRVGFPRSSLPLTVDEATALVRDADLSWKPPARAEESLPDVPAKTGEDVGDVLFNLEGIVHEYETDEGAVRAVDSVDLTIREGEVVAIVGHNGSGKTTLAKHLNGLLDPDEGTAIWDDRNLRDCRMSEVGRSIGYVFQNPDHQIFASTVRDEVAFGPENFGLSGKELDHRVQDAIETVELDGLEDADPFNFSKGQRQRVALASILATDPEVIIFDEPTTGLDAQQQETFMDLIARLNREEGVTVVMVTHSMPTVAMYAPRTVVMEDGRKVGDEPTRKLFADQKRLDKWNLHPPQPVELSNRLTVAAGVDDGLPALSVDELVAGFQGETI